MNNLIKRTTLNKSSKYSTYTQNNVYLKPENLQNTGSIKVHALYNEVKKAKDSGYEKVVINSCANTAKATAYLANAFDLKCDVYLPITTSYSTFMEIEEYHATVLDDSEEIKLSDKDYYIDISNNQDCSNNYSSVVKEIFEDNPDTDILLVPVGHGSLINGVINYVNENNLKVKIYAVEPYSRPIVTSALKHDKPVELNDLYTIAENLNSKTMSLEFFENIKNNIAGVISVSDDELIDCFLDVLEENKFIVEMTGLLALAGSKYLKEKNKEVVAILTGGNLDITTMSSLLEIGLQNKGRIFTFTTMLSDKPGELLEVASTIAEYEGNVVGLNHNQLSALTRSNKVELIVSVETLGLNHKYKICQALENKGYEIKLIDDHLGCEEDG